MKRVCGLVVLLLLGSPSRAAAGSLKAYVANAFDGTVSVVDARRGTAITTVPAGCDPRTVAANPKGSRVYVGNACLGDLDAHPGTVTVIDTASDSVVTEVAVGVEPFDLAVDPDGSRLLVANLGCGDPECAAAVPGSISLVDTETNVTTQEIDVGGRPKGILFHPDGDRLYVAVAGAVQVRDAATFDLIDAVALSPTSGGMADELDGGWAPGGLALHRGSGRLVVTNFYSGDVLIMNRRSGRVIHTAQAGAGANDAVLVRTRH